MSLDKAGLELVRSALQRCAFLRELDKEAIEQLINHGCQTVEYKFGTRICQAGAICDSLLILASGKVRLLRQGSSPTSTQFSVEALATFCVFSFPGDLIGAELFDSASRSFKFSARAAADSVMIRIPAETILRLSSRFPGIGELLRQQTQFMTVADELYRLERFRGVPFWSLRSLLIKMQHVEAETANHVGDLGSDLFASIVMSGKLEDESGKEYRKGSVVIFGSSNGSGPRTADQYKVVESGVLLLLEQRQFLELKSMNPGLAQELVSSAGAKADASQLLDKLAQSISESPQRDESGQQQPNKSGQQQPNKSGQQQPQPARPDFRENIVTSLRRSLHSYPEPGSFNSMDCGAICLNLICSFYGKQTSLKKLREMTDVSSYGTSALSLAFAAEKLGFTCSGIKATYEALQSIRLPAICHWNQDHFVVLFEANPDYAIVGDPASETRRIGTEEFSNSYSGVTLELTPISLKGTLAATDGFNFRKFFADFIWPYKKLVINALLANVIFQVLMLIMPAFTEIIVDRIIVHQNIALLYMILIGMSIFACFEAVVSLLRGFFLSLLAMKFEYAFVNQLLQHTLSLPLNFFEKRTVGDITSRFYEINKIQAVVAGPALSSFCDVTSAFICLTLIFYHDFGFGLATSVYLVLYVLTAVVYTPFLKRIGRRAWNRNTEANSVLTESIYCIEQIKCAGTESVTRWKWEENFIKVLNVRFEEAMAVSLAGALTNLLNLGGQIALSWLGALLTINNKITLGEYMALNMLVGMAAHPLGRIIELWDRLQDASIAGERLSDILESEPEQPEGNYANPGILSGRIKFEDVSFRYSNVDTGNAISHISFETTPGQILAFVGRSGSGKSTILKLMAGLYVPTHGRILVDGADLRHISLTDMRHQLGIVSQNVQIFRGSVKENISFYKPHASIEEVMEAAMSAGIHEHIMSLQQGYDTAVSESGKNFSGGQRQRISIARALLHKPRIVILDEATSALDVEAEGGVYRCLSHLKSSTIIVVAHRLSTIRNADLILVMDRGLIVERGSHEELMEQRGLYYYLASQQLGS